MPAARRYGNLPGMPVHIAVATRILSAGNKPKLIDEFIGRVTPANRA